MALNVDFLRAPDLGGFNMDSITGLLPELLWIIIGSIVLLIIIKMNQHRINVEIMEYVQGGYVSKYGRYAMVRDKKNQLEYLRPMFGKNRLPSFPTEVFQKTKGAPIIGMKRVLLLIKQNQYSYKVLLPPKNLVILGEVKYFDTLPWLFIEQKRQFLVKHKREKFLNALAVIAPIVVILMALGFFISMIFLQASITTHEAEEITKALEVVKQVYGT